MKTITNQQKHPIGLRLPVFHQRGGLINVLIQIFMRLMNSKETANKNSIKTCQKTLSNP